VHAPQISAGSSYIDMAQMNRAESIVNEANELITYVEVLTPWDIKWRHPAAQCRWNPLVSDRTPHAGDVVIADYEVECYYAHPDQTCTGLNSAGLADCCRKLGCYVTKITNKEEVSGEIALFSNLEGDNRECHTPQELSAVANEAGAVGALIPYYVMENYLPLFANPQALPYDFTIDTYIITTGSAESMIPFIDGVADATADPTDPDSIVDEAVVVKLPPTQAGWGETYYPHPDTYGALPQATIGIKVAGKYVSYEAGQAKFNPAMPRETEAQMVRGSVHESCWDSTGEGGKGGSGADCDLCHELLDKGDGSGITNGDGLAGRIVFLEAHETFCINEWETLVDNVEKHDAVGLVIGNEVQYTYTMIDAQQDITYIPVYNVVRSVADFIVEKLAAGRVTMKLPRSQLGIGALNTTSHASTITEDEWITQIKIVEPEGLEGTWEAGQADFNTEFKTDVFR